MTRSSFEHQAMPVELADAPDIENVPVAETMHELSATVVDLVYEVRATREDVRVLWKTASAHAVAHTELRVGMSTWLTAALSVDPGPTVSDLDNLRGWVDGGCSGDMPMPEGGD